MDNDLLFEIENLKNMLKSFPDKDENQGPKKLKKVASEEQNVSLLFPIVFELIHLVKSTFKFIDKLTQASRDKFIDRAFGDYFSRTVRGDTKKIDLLLDGVLDYIKVSTPVVKTNTVHLMIEEALKKNQILLEEKNIRLFKKFEKDLPEIAIPDDQLRYILNAIIQYAIMVSSNDGSIGFLTKSLALQRELPEDQGLLKREENYIEMLVQFTGYKMQRDQPETLPPLPISPREKLLNFELVLDLELRLVEEVVRKNRGTLKLETDEKKLKTSIILRFPVERRKVVYH
jgi:hypothetical protein